jgi:hypothetical protein
MGQDGKFFLDREGTHPAPKDSPRSNLRETFFHQFKSKLNLKNLINVENLIKNKFQDVKIHYVENGDRSKPLMLLLHGFPEFWFTWRKQLQYFKKTHW